MGVRVARISEEDIQKVRDATDVVALFNERTPVKQKGRDFWCCCPFHQEKTPSCKLDPATQLWHCFGCGEGGDIFNFVMKSEDMNFVEAVRYLAERAHIDIKESESGTSSFVPASRKARLKDICAKTAEFYHTQLMRVRGEQNDAARVYLASRGLGGEVPKIWNLGFAPGRGQLTNHLMGFGYTSEEMIAANVALVGRDGRLRDRFFNRVMFPINDIQGDCIAFGGRVIGAGEPKYLNSQETPLFHKSQVLYGLDRAKAAMASTGTALVVEGYTDVIALHKAGVTNAVATLGTALTMKHIRILSKHASKRIVYLFDGDAAGQRAADRALAFIDDTMTEKAGRAQIDLVAVTLPDNLDPAEFIEAKGKDALQELVDNAQPLLEYGISRRMASFDLETAIGRERALNECLQLLAPIKDSLVAKDYAVHIWSLIRAYGNVGITEADVLEQLHTLVPPRTFDQEEVAAEDAVPATPTRRLNQAEKNRLRFEREFLSICACNPLIALERADALAQVEWHDDVHRIVAESILNTLSENPLSTAADIVTKATAVCSHAARILTSASAEEGVDVGAQAAYLAEELSLGDAEASIGSLTAQMNTTTAPEELEILHAAVTMLQMDVAKRRLQHRSQVSL